MLVTGSGGVAVSGNPASVQSRPDDADAFNRAAGPEVELQVVSGSRKMR